MKVQKVKNGSKLWGLRLAYDVERVVRGQCQNRSVVPRRYLDHHTERVRPLVVRNSSRWSARWRRQAQLESERVGGVRVGAVMLIADPGAFDVGQGEANCGTVMRPCVNAITS